MTKPVVIPAATCQNGCNVGLKCGKKATTTVNSAASKN